MADIELVIKIPEVAKQIFDCAKISQLKDSYYDYTGVIGNAIKNGIPLPKGHGRIIDYGYVVDAIDDWVNAEEYRYTNATDYLRKRVANTPTIIEADKAESEDDEMKLINHIKAKMLLKRITQEEMAMRIGVTTVTMSRWMKEKRYPSSKYLEAMARELNCDLVLVEKEK